MRFNKGHSYIALLLISLQFGAAALCHAQSAGDIRINPLMSLPETLHQAQSDCAGRPYDYRCIQLIEGIQKDIEKLKEICKHNPRDLRCDAIRRKDIDRKSGIELFCADNPDHLTCVRRRENFKKSAIQKATICKKRPDAPECRPSIVRPDTAAAFEEYCQIYPDRRDCQRFKREKEVRRKDTLRQREKDAGGFTF